MNKLGFGFLRLPRVAGEGSPIDRALLEALVDAFLAGGGRYFDTAYTYLDGESETALRAALVQRHDRQEYILADKLPGWLVKDPGDCQRYFDEQCRRCGVDWFDVYLIHWLNPENYEIAEKYQQFLFLQRLKQGGKVGKIGFSYHGSAALLDRILIAHPEVDVVQLQINYLDWDDPGIEAGACYRVARSHGKEIVVMEPVKGGTLAQLPDAAAALLSAHAPARTPASWALHFAQGLEGISVVLSGMNTLAQIQENLQPVSPLTPEEIRLLKRAGEIINSQTAIRCTACGYCRRSCPAEIPIPEVFSLYNSYARNPGDGWKIQPSYLERTRDWGKASECLECHACERNCPQHLPISQYMKKVAAALE